MSERKGFLIRSAAWLIDGIIITAVWHLTWLLVQPSIPENLIDMTSAQIGAWAERVGGRSNMIVGICGLAMATVEVLWSRTPGKLLLRIRVLDQSGTIADLDQRICRAALKYGVYLFYLVGGALDAQKLVWAGFVVGLTFICGCFVALGSARQGLHDLLGRTAVYGRGASLATGFAPLMPISAANTSLLGPGDQPAS